MDLIKIVLHVKTKSVLIGKHTLEYWNYFSKFTLSDANQKIFPDDVIELYR